MRRLTISTVACVVLVGPAGCDRPTLDMTPPPPPIVTVARPVRMDAPIYVEYTGRTAPIAFAEIRARVEGYLKEKRFMDSADVKAGQELFLIDPAPYDAAVLEASAEVQRRTADLQQAEWDLERVQDLARRGASTEKEVQDRQTGRALAEAELEVAKARLTQAELDRSYADVRSPIDGRVGRNLVDVGNLVGAGEPTLLARVVTMDPMYVYFNVSERLLLEQLATLPRERRQPAGTGPKPETPFWARLAHEEGFPHEGVLDFIDNTVDPATGTITVRGVVPNDDALLFPGAFVRVRLEAGVRDNAVLVHEESLGTDVGGKYVLVVADTDEVKNMVELRPVVLGALVDGMRVIEEGLTGDERYIVKGLQRARPGLPVTPQMQTEEATAAR